MGPHENEVLHSKGNHQQDKKKNYWTGKDICKRYIP